MPCSEVRTHGGGQRATFQVALPCTTCHPPHPHRTRFPQPLAPRGPTAVIGTALCLSVADHIARPSRSQVTQRQLHGASSQVKSSQVKSSQVKSSQVKSSQAKPSQAKPSQAKSSQVKSSQVKSSQVKSSQVKSSQSSQVKSSQVKSSQVKSSQVKSSQVKSSQSVKSSQVRCVVGSLVWGQIRSSQEPSSATPPPARSPYRVFRHWRPCRAVQGPPAGGPRSGGDSAPAPWPLAPAPWRRLGLRRWRFVVGYCRRRLALPTLRPG